MGFSVNIDRISQKLEGKTILENLSLKIEAGQFVAILGENGAGKTSLLDLIMGFKKPSSGKVELDGQTSHLDPWALRHEICYLSEKVDLPGDWTVEEFLMFNRFFYKSYSSQVEAKLRNEFKVNLKAKIGNMSAGELRRVQIVASLSIRPKLVIIDEITAVLDIVGRRKFLNLLSEINLAEKCTILIATNILEGLDGCISHLLLMEKGRKLDFTSLLDFLGSKPKDQFVPLVADRLERT
jgi:ABC-2 type transport system ATP-binding protein